MAIQPGFPFDEIEAERLTPICSTPAMPPVNGTSLMTRHASATGAIAAWKDRSSNIKRLRDLWTVPRTIQEVSTLTGLPINSVCSLKAAMADELDEVGFETVHWGDGRRDTKRTQYQLKTARAANAPS